MMATKTASNVETGQVAVKMGTTYLSGIDSARVHLTEDDRLRIEFNIQDLVKRLLPGVAVAHCGGCNGCMGCSMID